MMTVTSRTVDGAAGSVWVEDHHLPTEIEMRTVTVDTPTPGLPRTAILTVTNILADSTPAEPALLIVLSIPAIVK
jgi:hypothetical protein